MEFNPHPLKGQVAIITGASSGIGASTALLLAKAGANVVITARRVDRLEEISAKIKALNNGVEVVVSALDVRDKAAFEKLATETRSKFGKIDILVNNAGVMLLSFARKLKYEEWNDMVDINIKGVLNGIAAVLTIMREQKSGHIVNISSDADRKVFPGSSVYSGTKAFVSMLSEGLRMELCQEGIPVHVTSISSGAVISELATHISDSDVTDIWAKGPPMTPMQSDDVAEIVLFALTRPGRVNLNNVLVRPVEQAQ